MADEKPFVITISRQIGSGGGYLGQRLAGRLGFVYADREIVRQAAERLHMSEEAAESLDERVTTFWESLLRTFEYGGPDTYVTPPIKPMPSDSDFHQAELEVVKSIAENRSSIIVGRAGFYVLRNNPRHLSVFLHARIDFRLKRVQEAYSLSLKDAKELIEKSDRERRRYLYHITGRDWIDARQYHLCIDTSAVGLECAEEIIANAAIRKMKDTASEPKEAEQSS